MLFISTLGVLILNSGIAPGAAAIGSIDAPLVSGLETVLGGVLSVKEIAALVLLGALAGFHSTIFSASRVVFSMSRAAYLPTQLALPFGHRKTPNLAIFAVAVTVYLLVITARLYAEHISLVSLLLNMSVLAAMISYIIALLSYVVLRVRYPLMDRPYMSPLGVTGAITGLIIVSVAAVFMFTNGSFRFGLIILGCIYLLAMVAFFLFRKQAINSDAPEEAFALKLEAAGSVGGAHHD